ncbi:hypothetical protein ACJ41O_015333 [Fusarium nematophilum]
MILRLYEEMTVPLPGERPYGHNLNTDIFVMSQDPESSEYSLCRASLLIAIRQEIFVSFNTQRPPQPLAWRCRIEKTTEPADDFTWAWRIVIHTEHVLSHVYGTRDPLDWQELSVYLEEWTEKRPPSFNPIWRSEHNFPEVWFANDYHVAGQQYADICRILLLAHDPCTSAQSTDEQIRSLVRNLCGVAVCNSKHPPALFTAGMAIAVYGDRIIERSEQKQLLHILERAESHMGWSFLRQHERLRELWGLEE